MKMCPTVDDSAPAHQGTPDLTDGINEKSVNAVNTPYDQTSSQTTVNGESGVQTPENHDNDNEYTEFDALVDELIKEYGEPQDEHISETEQSGSKTKKLRSKCKKPGTTDRETVPETVLHTNQHEGLTDAEVHERRKQFGLNEMSDAKQNLLKKFLMFFVGPIQFVMEVG